MSKTLVQCCSYNRRKLAYMVVKHIILASWWAVDLCIHTCFGGMSVFGTLQRCSFHLARVWYGCDLCPLIRIQCLCVCLYLCVCVCVRYVVKLDTKDNRFNMVLFPLISEFCSSDLWSFEVNTYTQCCISFSAIKNKERSLERSSWNVELWPCQN